MLDPKELAIRLKRWRILIQIAVVKIQGLVPFRFY